MLTWDTLLCERPGCNLWRGGGPAATSTHQTATSVQYMFHQTRHWSTAGQPCTARAVSVLPGPSLYCPSLFVSARLTDPDQRRSARWMGDQCGIAATIQISQLRLPLQNNYKKCRNCASPAAQPRWVSKSEIEWPVATFSLYCTEFLGDY